MAQLQLQVDAFTGGNTSGNVVPFNEATCLAANYTDYPSNSSGGGPFGTSAWILYDKAIGASDADYADMDAVCAAATLNPSSCARECAKFAMKCDPCAMAKIACQDALAWALLQSGSVAPSQLAGFRVLNEAPGPPGPWSQTQCPTPTTGQVADFSSSPFLAKSFGWADMICGDDGRPVTLSWWGRMKNYWYPGDPSSYIDPSTLCNLPLRANDGNLVVSYSGLCYCTK